MISLGSILTWITSGFKDLLSWVADPKNHKFVLVVVVVLLSFFMFRQCGQIDDLENQNQRAQSNITALNDTLTQVKDDKGNLLAEKGALQGSLDDIRELNEELVDSLEYLKDNPITVTEIRYVTRQDTIFDIPTAGEYLGQDRFSLTWEHKDSGNWGRRELGGITRFTLIGDTSIVESTTDIVKDIMEMNITTGFTETDDGKLRIYARTNYPGAEFLQVDGAIIDPRMYVSSPESERRKRFGFGIQLGYGLTPDMNTSPYVGLGVSYNFIQW